MRNTQFHNKKETNSYIKITHLKFSLVSNIQIFQLYIETMLILLIFYKQHNVIQTFRGINTRN